MQKLKALFIALPVVMMATAAHAAIDVSELDGTKADVGIVGTAVFGVLVAIAGFRYVRRLL
jgi:hypothetical protein